MILVIGFNGVMANCILERPQFSDEMELEPGVLELLTRIKSYPERTLGFEGGFKRLSITRDQGIPEIALTSDFARDLVLSSNSDWYSDFMKLVTYEFWSDSPIMRGAKKADQEFFKKMLENLMVTPDELIVIDTDPKVVVAAELNRIFNVIIFRGADALEEQLIHEYGFEFFDTEV